jgi:THAP domain
VVNCRRADLDGKSAEDLHKNYVLCANHFEDSQFLNGLRNRLKWNAIPTLFDVSNLLGTYAIFVLGSSYNMSMNCP